MGLIMKIITIVHNLLKKGTFNYSMYMKSDTKPDTDLRWILFIGYLNQLPYLKVFFFMLFLTLWVLLFFFVQLFGIFIDIWL